MRPKYRRSARKYFAQRSLRATRRCAKRATHKRPRRSKTAIIFPTHERVQFLQYLDGGGAMHSLQSVVFTDVVNGCLEKFMSSDMFFADSPLLVPKASERLFSRTSDFTAVNVVHFLARVIDSVWSCLYRANPVRVLKCFLKLLADAHALNKANAQLVCTEAHLNALFRVVLYLLSRPACKFFYKEFRCGCKRKTIARSRGAAAPRISPRQNVGDARRVLVTIVACASEPTSARSSRQARNHRLKNFVRKQAKSAVGLEPRRSESAAFCVFAIFIRPR